MGISNWSGRTHRTMSSAFGPYTSNRLQSLREPLSLGEQAAGVALAIIGGISAAAFIIHWSLS